MAAAKARPKSVADPVSLAPEHQDRHGDAGHATRAPSTIMQVNFHDGGLLELGQEGTAMNRRIARMAATLTTAAIGDRSPAVR